MDEGGLERIWDVSTRGNRTLLVDWDFDPRTRHTVFSLVFGGYCTWVALYGVSQAQVQRYLCVRNKYLAIKALMINLVGLLTILGLCCLAGLVLYTKYVDCDPVSSGLVGSPDQILPLFVMDSLGDFKGLPGLFVAGIFSGSLSTVSSGINSLAAITLEDFIKVLWPHITEYRSTILTMIFSLMYGILTFLLVFIAELLGDILQASLAINGLITGPVAGVFTLGMFFPWANSKGAFVGTLSGIAVSLWIGLGAQIYKEEISTISLPLNTCDLVQVNGTFVVQNSRELNNNLIPGIEDTSDITLEFYKISYMFYAALGMITTILVGMIVSILTGLQDLRKLNPKLLSPAVYWFKWAIPGYHIIGTEFKEDDKSRQQDSIKIS